LLTSIAGSLPGWTTPDILTLTGVAGAGLFFIGCIASRSSSGFYLLAIFGLLLNWFGDSLDGSLARYREIERPRYGFFVDQFSDVVAHFFILFGLGFSTVMRLDIALMALLGSLLTMFYGHLRLQFARTWQVSHYGIGPTELRILIIGGLVLAMNDDIPMLTTVLGRFSLFDIV
ncbi:MAG: CDP-alcohol phosphatidyltransferase family protein, partial [Proteobacteria bacterium]|nr:CDP-alcohol phosphatidyltransferase family protein [Pseudomonadota bacterium]